MTSQNPLVLVVEDDEKLRKLLRSTLSAHDLRVIEASTAKEAIQQISTQLPDVVILDLGLPDRDGTEVVKEVRGWSTVPIIILSARDLETDKVRALDAGADDYVAKPFGASELMARVRVSLRHAAAEKAPSPEPIVQIRDLKVDHGARRVFLGEQELHLTPIEYKLLTLFIRHIGRVLTHRHVLQEVWGPPYVEEVQYLRGYMASLRRKIETDPGRPTYIITEPGIGYRMMDD
jgi:two-component system KDP operon response regulator KdpE